MDAAVTAAVIGALGTITAGVGGALVARAKDKTNAELRRELERPPIGWKAHQALSVVLVAW